MKKIKHLLVCAFLAFVLVAIAKAPVKAYSNDSIGKCYQKSCTAKTVTLEWTKPKSNGSYLNVTGYTIKDKNENVLANLGATSTSCTIDYDGTGTVYVYYYYTINNHTYYSYYYAYVNTKPQTPAKDNFGIGGILSSTKKVYIVFNKPSTGVSGAEVQVYKGSKCVYDKNVSYSTEYFSISKNAVYKYRIRYYYKNYDSAFGDSGKLFYGSWSGYRSFDFASASLKAKSSKKGFYVTVKKASGISSYTLKIKTSSNGKYKTIKTLKNKNYTVRITSKYKKKATNYIEIIPNIKGYGKSDIYSTGSIYVYK